MSCDLIIKREILWNTPHKENLNGQFHLHNKSLYPAKYRNIIRHLAKNSWPIFKEGTRE